MDAKRYAQVRDVFLAVEPLAQAERDARLDALCADDPELRREVQSLLENVAAGEFLAGTPLRQAAGDLAGDGPPTTAWPEGSEAATAPPTGLPARIGNYAVRRVLGVGGMGIVYLAEQEHPRRQVALKVMRAASAAPEAQRRFVHEAQILGRLQHPGIAQIYEGGFASGVPGGEPFFAMEYIVGAPVTRFALERRLDVRARLELLARVADAVHHAHQKGIVHRDLKPANILVDAQGQPKVLDFGVARLTDPDQQVTVARTDIGAVIGTLPYMSPEQVSGAASDIDIRSDVYSLGVVLYELLAGQLPYDLRAKSLVEAARIIADVEPPSLATISRRFRGDLHTIVRRALEKERERRYASASELAADLRRYLRDEPIAARPATLGYQFRKFARRNRAVVAGAAGVGLALLLGVVGSSYGLMRALKGERAAVAASNRAQRAAARALATTRFLREMLASADPERVQGAALSVRDVLDDAARKLSAEPDSLGIATSAVQLTLGDTYRALGEFAQAQTQLENAYALVSGHADVDPTERIEIAHALAKLRLDQGQYDTAREILDEGLAMLAGPEAGAPAQLAADLYLTRAAVSRAQDDLAGAEADIRAARELLGRTLGERGVEFARVLIEDARFHRQAARLDEAAASAERAVEIVAQKLGAQNATYASFVAVLAGVRADQGALTRALELFEQAAAIRRQIYGVDHAYYGVSLNAVAALQARLGQQAEALANWDEALRIYRVALPQARRDRALLLQNRATALQHDGRLDEAIASYEEALLDLEAAFSGDHSHTATVWNALGGALRRKEDYAGAERAYRRALEMRERIYGGDHPLIASTRANLGWLRLRQEMPRAALAELQESLEMRARLLPPDHPDLAHALEGIALAQRALGAADAALEAIARCASIRLARLGPASWPTISARLLYAELLAARGDETAASTIRAELRALADDPTNPLSPGQRRTLAARLAGVAAAADAD